MVYEFGQDDPRKCTSVRLRKFGIAKKMFSLKQIPDRAIVLNPTVTKTLTSSDRGFGQRFGIVALDCSWNRSDESLKRPIPGENRRLPTLLAGNPVNYSIPHKLTTAEAIAAALYIIGFQEEAERVLSIFGWGATFLEMNRDPLEEYSRSSPGGIAESEAEFFGPGQA